MEVQGVSSAFESQNRQFLQMFSTLSWIALIVVIVAVTLFSVFMANSLSKPLVQIKQIATKMRAGDLSSRVKTESQITEIEEVGLSLNHLADTLEQQDQLRKNLTADIAHELRTPIATIQSHIEAFQDGIWETTPDKLDVCHKQVIRLVKLIQDLENLSAVENPMLKLKKDPVSLNQVIQDSITSVKEQFSHKEIILDLHQAQQVVVMGDYTRLVQVFTNLLHNAFKYTNQGRIHVEITEEQTVSMVKISDTGLGIGEDELPYIFERFYRGEKSRNRKTGGAGIGLAIVKAIVDAHEGSIEVQSELNKGTEFTIRFPHEKR
ncbi:Signal transduction histidine-protein kinase BaeS [compost metagenome]